MRERVTAQIKEYSGQSVTNANTTYINDNSVKEEIEKPEDTDNYIDGNYVD